MNVIRHLLVDGANILHRSSELAPLAKRDRCAARSLLANKLVAIHDGGKVRVTLVFDGRGSELVVEHPTGEPSFSVIHTPAGTTADDIIEHMVANSAHPAECCVVTEDNAERETITAAGAVAIDAGSLATWLERVTAGQQRTIANLRAQNTRAWKKS